MTVKVEWVTTTCGCGCGVTFRQLRDPGREREYLNNAHKQRAYRARNPHRSHSGTHRESASARRRREQEEAWAREEARREKERQRARQRRGTQETTDVPPWCRRNFRDDPATAKRREKARLLMERGLHRSTNDHERDACLGMAERMRAKYGL